MNNIEEVRTFSFKLKDGTGIRLVEKENYDKLVKRIKELEKETTTLKNFTSSIYNENIEKEFIPVRKVKDFLIQIQEEFNKLDKETDKQIKDKNKDYYKCKENIAIMQTLAYCRDNLKELLEESK